MKFFFWKYLISGDALVLDRWRFILRYLPITREPLRLLDVGCGSGAFTIGAALRGYRAVGLSWDRDNQSKAERRSIVLGVSEWVDFPIVDARALGESGYERETFDYVLCLENAEHIIDDEKLICDIASLLKPSGVLLFSAPYRFYKAITSADNGPFCHEETGWHVRRGYSEREVAYLMEAAGLDVEKIGFCSFAASQKATWLLRSLASIFGYSISWAITFPVRLLAMLLDPLCSALPLPGFSVTAVAIKRRTIKS